MKRKECVVIGLGRFGTSVAENLAATGNDVLAIDINEDAVRHILDKVAHAVQADIQDEEVDNSIESDDSIGLRSEESLDIEPKQEESNIEIQEVKQKFENLVWSEDKFPKK